VGLHFKVARPLCRSQNVAETLLKFLLSTTKVITTTSVKSPISTMPQMWSTADWPICRSAQAITNISHIILTHHPTQDLNQDDQFVRSTLLQWAASLRDLGFDGLRVDTVPEVKPAFWAEFTQAAAMYTVGTHVMGTQARPTTNLVCRRGFQR
jgi:hypothetical protein